MDLPQQVYKFETSIKQIKRRKKQPYVDIMIRYEIKNKDIGIDDFIDVNCISPPQIYFLNATLGEKSIVNIINYELQDNKVVAYLEDIIEHAKRQTANQRIQFIISFLDYVKLNRYSHVFSLNKQSKNIPEPDYIYYADTKFKEETKAQLNQIQNFIDQKNIDPTIPKVYFYFLETPVSVNQKKMIKIRVSDQKNMEVDEINSPYIFTCNILGCLEIPKKLSDFKIDDNSDFEDMLENLLPKHTIFVVRAFQGELKNLASDDIVGGYYKMSPEFLEGFKLVVQYIATGSLP
ncbi:hypothetical protein ABPG74_001506 [Tetrahymena malaccensis]